MGGRREGRGREEASKQEERKKASVMTHYSNSSTQEAEEGECLC